MQLPGPDCAQRAASRRARLNHRDAIVDAKGRMSFDADSGTFVPYCADIGTGESDPTDQQMTGIRHAFKWGDRVAQWRDPDYDFGDKFDELSFNGPAIAVNFRW